MGHANRTGRIHGDDERRFWSKIDKNAPGGCWVWTKALTRAGYGRFTIRTPRKRAPLAHRYSWELVNGPVPDGLELDHLCRNKACVNPAHLEAVTHTENVRRGNSPCMEFARRTHCKRGHELSGDNIHPNPNGYRICHACFMLKQREAWKRNDAKRKELRRLGLWKRKPRPKAA